MSGILTVAGSKKIEIHPSQTYMNNNSNAEEHKHLSDSTLLKVSYKLITNFIFCNPHSQSGCWTKEISNEVVPIITYKF